MGTRHLEAAYINGEYKIAQYGQWDGYPDGQGIETLHFLRDEMDEAAFREKLAASTFIQPQELDDLWKQYGADDEGFISLEGSTKMKRDHPELHRDTGAKIFRLVQDAPAGIKIDDSLVFAADGLLCEWVWVIDLDNRTFEGYEGLQKEPLDSGERFFFLEEQAEHGYHPCKLVAKWSLDDLPSDEEFLAAFKSEEDESE